MTSEKDPESSVKFFPKITWTAGNWWGGLYISGWTRAPDGTLHQLMAKVGDLNRTATKSAIRSCFAEDIGGVH